jgi:hypothetical protein
MTILNCMVMFLLLAVGQALFLRHIVYGDSTKIPIDPTTLWAVPRVESLVFASPTHHQRSDNTSLDVYDVPRALFRTFSYTPFYGFPAVRLPRGQLPMRRYRYQHNTSRVMEELQVIRDTQSPLDDIDCSPNRARAWRNKSKRGGEGGMLQYTESGYIIV